MRYAPILLLACLAACGGGGDDRPRAEQIASSTGPWRCVDFSWREDAQSWYDRHPGARPDLPPEYTMDKTGDGIVDCPNLPDDPSR